MPERTVIVGGGLAGLAAAVALSERGLPVTVLESRPRLGGRASSFVDKATGESIDNCQHVSLGCCTNLRHFCRTVGLDGLFRSEPALFFIGRDNRVNRLTASRLPAPLHFLPSFSRLSYLSTGDRLCIGRALRALARARSEECQHLAFGDWLQRHGQTPAAVDRFWTPVLVSALSESLDRIDVASARKVFVDAFLANRQGWQVQIPLVPLDALYGADLTKWLGERGSTVRLQSGAERIVIEPGGAGSSRAVGVRLRSGEMVPAEHVIVAVPHWLLLDLLPETLRTHPDIAPVGGLETAPISSVHLWFDRPILFPPGRAGAGPSEREHELPHAVLIERLSQWVFNRTALQSAALSRAESGRSTTASGPATRAPDQPQAAGYSYQVVISASRNVAAVAQTDAIAQVVAELAEIFPESRKAVLLHSRLVTEHRAVFSVRPGCDALRPAQQSPVANLCLAGDWTRTFWPATMEGAVRSGYLAAERVLVQRGRPGRVVQPDLPVALLSRLLFGLRAHPRANARP